MSYRKTLVVSCLVILMCGCASKRTQQELEQAEIKRVLDKAYATDRPILRTCQSLVIDLEGKPVDYAPVVGQVVALVVLIPLMVAARGDFRGFGGVGGPDSDPFENSRANALARDRITVRCIVAISTEQRVGPDHVEMAVPLFRLAQAYQLASIDPKGLAVQQAQRLFERGESLVEKVLARAEKDDEYATQIDDALTSYITVLREVNRDWQSVCSRAQRLRSSPQCAVLF